MRDHRTCLRTANASLLCLAFLLLFDGPLCAQNSAIWPASWQVFGPFPESEAPPDPKVYQRIPESIRYSGGTLTARTASPDTSGKINFGTFLKIAPSEKMSVLIFGEIDSTQAQTIDVGAGADWWMEWYLNGKKVYDTMTTGNGTSQYGLQNHRMRMTLVQGKNIVAARIVSGSKGFMVMTGDEKVYYQQESAAAQQGTAAAGISVHGGMIADFGRDGELDRFSARDASVSLARNEDKPVMRISGSGGVTPEITLAPDSGWDLSGYGMLSFSIKNLGQSAVTNVFILTSQPPENGSGISRMFYCYLPKDKAKTFRIPLIPFSLRYNDIILGTKGMPYFKNTTSHLKKVTRIALQLKYSADRCNVAIGNITASGTPLPDFPQPLVDRFGQYMYDEWPGKVHAEGDLMAFREAEAADLAAYQRPSSWNIYGGWKDGPKLQATGFFRTEKYQGKWYFVDPEGRLFLSVGFNEVGSPVHTPVVKRERFFTALPPDNDQNRDFYRTSPGHAGYSYMKGAPMRCFSHGRYNTSLKYGNDYAESIIDVTLRRLPSWGVNSMFLWSGTTSYYTRQKVPYVLRLEAKGPRIEASKGSWSKFPDVFHPDFTVLLEKMLLEKGVADSLTDPWCIGYTVDNEMSWEERYSEKPQGQTGLALATLMSPPGQHAKKAFIRQLTETYSGIESLNRVWGTAHRSWDALLESTTPPDVNNAQTDLTNFYAFIADTYYRRIRAVLREKAPNHLYLGDRTHRFAPLVLEAAGRHCDVVSFNYYAPNPSTIMPLIRNAGDKPYLIMEYGFGATDHGVLNSSHTPVIDQDDRAQIFKNYMTEVIRDQNLVGAYWYCLNDQAVTGRFYDGENYNWGWVDICDTPYPEMVAAGRYLGENMYRMRAEQQ